MADDTIPKRLRILRALTEKLTEITPTNGYQTNVSENVYRGRARFGEGDPVPMIAILQSPRTLDIPPSPGAGAIRKTPLELLIQGFCVDDFQHPTDPAEVMMADTKRCLAEIIAALGKRPYVWNEIETLSIGPGVCRPPDEEISAVAYFWLSVTIEFTENVTDPYAVPAA